MQRYVDQDHHVLSFSKEDYDYLMNIIESKKNEINSVFDESSSRLNDCINNLNTFKEKLVKDKELCNARINEFNELISKVIAKANKEYLNSGNTLSKIALRALPPDNKLIKELDDAIENLDLSEKEKQNVKKEYMNVVRTERNKGGRKRKINRTKRHKKTGKYQ